MFINVSEIIDYLSDFLTIPCMPENLYYFKPVQLENGKVHLVDFDVDILNSFAKGDAEYLIADSGQSFCFKIETENGINGIFVVEKIHSPDQINECVKLILGIKKIFGLAIENIEHRDAALKAQKQLADSNELLRIINKTLRHDLTNNFAAIKMSLEMYDMNPKDKYLEISKKAVNSGLSRINDMRNLENLIDEGGSLKLYCVKEILDSVIDREADLSISVKGDCQVLADGALPSVFDNLIKNAVLHGNASQIEITMEPTGSYCKISISDDGTGIPENIKERIFEEGFTSASQGHSGLGLYIVKKTVERYGGKVTVEKNTPHGTTFVLNLPSI